MNADWYGGTTSYKVEGPFRSVSNGRTPICSSTLPARTVEGPFRSVSNGRGYSCGLHTSGAVFCWGWLPVDFVAELPGTLAAFSTGDWHSCGLRPDGTVDCWSPYHVASPGVVRWTDTTLE